MDWDRNRYFTVGVVLFLLGIQFRMIDTYVLNDSSTRALYRFAKNSQIANSGPNMTDIYMSASPSAKKSIQPPPWLGWAMLTAGGVMSLHALALPKKQ